MKQPELGRKIAELRKAKGLTQEELVDKCNLNVRTLQRIESGEVLPRSYTLKVIFAALDYEFYDFMQKQKSGRLKVMTFKRAGRFIRNVIEIFNLKRNTMKKVSILSTSLLILFLGACMFNFLSDKRIEGKLRDRIVQQNKNSVNWFNSGNIDLLLEDYASNTCFYCNNQPSYCGIEKIRDCIQKASSSKLFQMVDIELLSLKVADSIAVEKSLTTSKLQSGQFLKTINLQEWHRINGDWLIVNYIDVAIK